MSSFSIIIPHFNGEEILENCLKSLFFCKEHFEVIVVDNGSTDRSIEQTNQNFPQVKIVKSLTNLGYAGGCTFGANYATNDWLIFLNNDTEVDDNWLKAVDCAIQQFPHAKIFQPKILSLQEHRKNKKVFDYAGGAGGRMDWLGYPFAFGRVMWKVLDDTGKYDYSQPLFWASGTALVIEKQTAEWLGFFDELYFAHMEEIDLCWRYHQMGGTIYSIPDSIVYHLGGQTLALGHPKKIYLNHRNNWYLVFKNLPFCYFLLVSPVRIVLDFLAMIMYTLQKGKDGFLILPQAYSWLWKNKRIIFVNRKKWLDFKSKQKATSFFSIIKKLNPIPVVLRIPLQAIYRNTVGLFLK